MRQPGFEASGQTAGVSGTACLLDHSFMAAFGGGAARGQPQSVPLLTAPPGCSRHRQPVNTESATTRGNSRRTPTLWLIGGRPDILSLVVSTPPAA